MNVVVTLTPTGKVKVYSSRETVPKSFKANLLDDCPTKLTLISGGPLHS